MSGSIRDFSLMRAGALFQEARTLRTKADELEQQAILLRDAALSLDGESVNDGDYGMRRRGPDRRRASGE